ncbi:protein kinase domain-containing protein [Marinomonas mediterranea]|uniref:protein kinase domain-containing protein n=1 Tax=Marinomonas mediterranea TaxID=119864 RepID=UPI00234BA4CC|nr:RIO1 family regulatory kinase/ATPase [Marinomonas mediterranea]WCN08133.1 protein kinase [Marinomonas mediterranea]WCN12202.1 protein kinase [Marinomonas mediterranea]
MSPFFDEINTLFPNGVIESIGPRCFLVRFKGDGDQDDKEIRVKLATSPLEVQCLQREALWLHRLRRTHLSVQHSASLERHGSLLLLTSSYVQGSSVDQLLRNSAVTLEQRKSMITQLLALLDDLYSEGIVHGDIKLSNLIMGKSDTLSLIDFANMRRIGEPLADRGVIQVTPCYQYPKQVSIAHPYMDVYAALLCIGMLASGNAKYQVADVRSETYLENFFHPSDTFKWLGLEREVERQARQHYGLIKADLNVAHSQIETKESATALPRAEQNLMLFNGGMS